MFNNLRVCVTGGCGFIGSHLVKRLMGLGAYVVVLDSLEYGHNLPPVDSKTQFYKFKLGVGHIDALRLILQNADIIFHLAAKKRHDLEQYPIANLNVLGTDQLLQVATAVGVKKVIFTSSLYAYGRVLGPPMVETELMQPTTSYGISKLQCERSCHRMSVLTGIPVVVLRLFFTYGPRYSAAYPSVITKNFKRMLAGEWPIISGDGMQVLDYSYVDDVVDALVTAAAYDKFGIFNVGTGLPLNIQNLIYYMQQVAGTPQGYEIAPADWTAGSRRVADITKFKTQFGILPRTSLNEGLHRTFDWMIEQPGAQRFILP